MDKIKLWLTKNTDCSSYTLSPDGLVNIKGDIKIKTHVTSFPFKFGTVTGRFDCNGCTGLTSLKNAPILCETFWCYGCTGLTDLIGAPVCKEFNCGGCTGLADFWFELAKKYKGNWLAKENQHGAIKIIFGS